MEFRASGARVLNSLTNFDKICVLERLTKSKPNSKSKLSLQRISRSIITMNRILRGNQTYE